MRQPSARLTKEACPARRWVRALVVGAMVLVAAACGQGAASRGAAVCPPARGTDPHPSSPCAAPSPVALPSPAPGRPVTVPGIPASRGVLSDLTEPTAAQTATATTSPTTARSIALTDGANFGATGTGTPILVLYPSIAEGGRPVLKWAVRLSSAAALHSLVGGGPLPSGTTLYVVAFVNATSGTVDAVATTALQPSPGAS